MTNNRLFTEQLKLWLSLPFVHAMAKNAAPSFVFPFLAEV